MTYNNLILYRRVTSRTFAFQRRRWKSKNIIINNHRWKSTYHASGVCVRTLHTRLRYYICFGNIPRATSRIAIRLEIMCISHGREDDEQFAVLWNIITCIRRFLGGVFFFFFLHHITPPQPTCIYYCTLCTYRATPTERVYGLGGNGKTCRIPNVKLKSKIVKKKINNKQIRIISYVRQKW